MRFTQRGTLIAVNVTAIILRYQLPYLALWHCFRAIGGLVDNQFGQFTSQWAQLQCRRPMLFSVKGNWFICFLMKSHWLFLKQESLGATYLVVLAFPDFLHLKLAFEIHIETVILQPFASRLSYSSQA